MASSQELLLGTGTAVNAFQIQRSLRFNSADSAYLNRTLGSGNRKTWTWSGWVKRAALSNDYGGTIISCATGTSDSNSAYFWFYANAIRFQSYFTQFITTTAVYRDVSAWYHIVLAVDTTQATASNRIKLYVNGTQVTAFDAANYPAQNTDLSINSANSHTIGLGDGTYSNFYLTNINFIDGQALTPSSFGETNADTGVWQPKAYSGTYGTNGFQLLFADNSGTTSTTLGKDTSGNGNNWTPNNFSVTAGAGNDSLVDTPTPYGTDTGAGGEVRGNYCTLNPLNSTATLFNGNLDSGTLSAIANWLPTSGTIGVSSGKWYWEVRMNSVEYLQVGIFPNTYAAVSGTYPGSASTSGYGYQSANGNKYVLGTGSSYGATFTTGDVIGVALDLDAGTLVFYKNGVSQGTAASSISGTFVPGIAVYNSTGASTVANCNFGQRPFAYTAPSGFKALCTQNLPTPTIGATSATQAGKYFNPVLYTGNGNATAQAITGTGFQPDWVWIKARSNTYVNLLFDAVRGAGKQLISELTNAESTVSNFVSFDSDGFTVNAAGGASSYNANGTTYVAWNWKAGGAGVTNTQGAITSTVSANTTAGFSIVTWTANGTQTGSVGHGLGVTPTFIIYKKRNGTSDWYVWITFVNGNQYLLLNATNTVASLGSTYGSPTSTTISNYGWANGDSMLAYCFAPVAGYSAFGSYTGNGSADGPFIYTGFRPAFVMFKATNALTAWLILDDTRNTYNLVNSRLFPNQSSAEDSASGIDLLSNGFKLRSTSGLNNDNGITYVYAAFAEFPLKYTLAR